MRGFYHITEKIKEIVDNDGYINVVTEGDIFEVDLNKQTIFPLLHIITDSAIIQKRTTQMDFTLLCLDVVDDKNATDLRDTLEPFFQTTNEQDVLNSTLNYLNNIIAQFRRGSAYDDFYQLAGDPVCTPVREAFTNLITGWSCTFSVLVQNEQPIC